MDKSKLNLLRRKIQHKAKKNPIISTLNQKDYETLSSINFQLFKVIDSEDDHHHYRYENYHDNIEEELLCPRVIRTDHIDTDITQDKDKDKDKENHHKYISSKPIIKEKNIEKHSNSHIRERLPLQIVN